MKYTLLVFLFFYSLCMNAQVTYEKIYGNNSDYETGNSLIVKSDTEYVFTGVNQNFPPGSGSAYLMKVNQFGDTVFTKSYPIFSEGNSVQSTFDGGYIITGRYDTIQNGSDFIYLIKTNAVGDTDWTRTYLQGGAYSVKQTPDSGYILAGNAVIKTSTSGDTLWTRDSLSSFPDFFYSIDLTPDSGLVLFGERINGNAIDAEFVKLNRLGDTLWIKYFDGGGFDIGKSVKLINGGTFILAATTFDTLNFKKVIWIIKTNDFGDSIWSKKISGIDDYEVNDVSQTNDGGFILTGDVYNSSTNEGDLLLIKTDSLGDVKWTKTFSHNYNDEGKSVRQTSDGGYIIVGNTDNIVTSGEWDIYLIKTDSLGNIDSTITNTYNFPISENKITIFPNPAINYFVINNLMTEEAVLLQISDLIGQTIYEDNLFGKSKYIVDLYLPKGIYFVNIKNGETHSTKKLIIE